MYEELFGILKEKFPELEVSGDNYPPLPIFLYLAYTVSVLRVVLFIAILAGPQFLQGIGIQNPPPIYQWSQDNKITACLLVFFVCNQLESQFMSTGAFEVTLNGQMIWSKLDSGRLPNLQEITQHIEERQQLFNVNHDDEYSFPEESFTEESFPDDYTDT